MFSSVYSSVFSYFLDRLFEDCRWIFQAYLFKLWQNIRICEMFFSLNLYRCRVLYFRIYSCFWSIINPLSDKYFVLLAEEIRSLAFSFIVYPMTFEMISDSFCQNSIAASFAHVPHAFVDISVQVYHSSLSMWQVIHPHTVISVSILEKHGSSTLLWIALPITSIFSS